MNISMHATFPPSFLFKKLVSSNQLPGLRLLGQRVWMFLWFAKQQADRLFPEGLVFIYVATSSRGVQGPALVSPVIFNLCSF